MLQHSSLPPTLIPQCLDVLLKGTSERDFMRIVVEIVQSLRRDSQLVTSDSELSEVEDDDDSSEEEEGAEGGKKRQHKRKRSSGPEQIERRKELDLRCLIVVKALLERVMSVRRIQFLSRPPLLTAQMGDFCAQALQENSMLHGLVAELIVPAVKTKDFEVRAQGLICLGLCCLLDKVSLESLALFRVYNVLTMYSNSLWLSIPSNFSLDKAKLQKENSKSRSSRLCSICSFFTGSVSVKREGSAYVFLFSSSRAHELTLSDDSQADIILGFLSSSLDQEDPRVAATAVVGIAKLILSGMVTDEEVSHC